MSIMNCGLFEQLTIFFFVVGLIGANIFNWIMEKNVNLAEYNGPMWKLWLFGDVTLPKSILNRNGRVWRLASISFFLLLVSSGITIGILNYKGSVCFGLNT